MLMQKRAAKTRAGTETIQRLAKKGYIVCNPAGNHDDNLLLQLAFNTVPRSFFISNDLYRDHRRKPPPGVDRDEWESFVMSHRKAFTWVQGRFTSVFAMEKVEKEKKGGRRSSCSSSTRPSEGTAAKKVNKTAGGVNKYQKSRNRYAIRKRRVAAGSTAAEKSSILSIDRVTWIQR
uniref:RNase NYN domain-containing protein n=1 Tax=Chromera velia CCMP2878 TaxID=1169474 RepID=A0A0G4FGE6_9ALVE|eukprot:Cvel_16840.t1-p1 / transcript=Cvel_16840.t1 / gene=Cvel_16840 / organism=Chromera_velia_CCMP2878 / gene_product=hypothetical protein / transcript_product=hypothetical protein / location=Cvel_scaffold1316:46803-47843(-) / protein_length=175 / sequence_SO=supercontig / SO=protein_coding / is_pseudo=false